MATEPEVNWEQYIRLVTKAMSDPEFKRDLLADPEGTLRKEGVELDPTVKVRVLEDTEQLKHFIVHLKGRGPIIC